MEPYGEAAEEYLVFAADAAASLTVLRRVGARGRRRSRGARVDRHAAAAEAPAEHRLRGRPLARGGGARDRTPACARPCWLTTARSARRSCGGVPRPTRSAGSRRWCRSSPGSPPRSAAPLALVEVGASAGLCLYPDRYAYRWTTDGGDVALPLAGAPELTCRVRRAGAAARIAHPVVGWRAGVDLNPLDVTDPDAGAWLAEPGLAGGGGPPRPAHARPSRSPRRDPPGPAHRRPARRAARAWSRRPRRTASPWCSTVR